MARIPYPDVGSLSAADQEILEFARQQGTPRPESQAIRAHVPAVLHAFTRAWRETFLEGIVEHSLKELCRVFVSQSIACEY